MKIKMSRGEKIFQVVNYFVLSIIVLVCLYPMWHVAMASFSNSTQLMAHSGFLLKPMGFNMQAYLKVFQNPMILKGYANTLFILIVGVILDLIMTALAAYFFSRKGVMFKKPLMLSAQSFSSFPPSIFETSANFSGSAGASLSTIIGVSAARPLP